MISMSACECGGETAGGGGGGSLVTRRGGEEGHRRGGDDVGDDLHVGVRMWREARGGRDAVFVDDEEVAEARPARVVVAVEGERVPAVEPVCARAPALFGGPSGNHRPDSFPLSPGQNINSST